MYGLLCVMQAGREAAAAVGLQCRYRHGAGTSAARARGAYDSLPVTQADWRGTCAWENTGICLSREDIAGAAMPWTGRLLHTMD